MACVPPRLEQGLLNRTKRLRLLDRAGRPPVTSIEVAGLSMSLARFRPTGHGIVPAEPVRLSVIPPWFGSIRREVKGNVFDADAGGVLVFDPNWRRSAVLQESKAGFNGPSGQVLLAATWRSDLSKEQAALTDPKRPAHPADRETGLLCVNDVEGIQFPSFAMKAAAYVGKSPFAGKAAPRIAS